MNIQDFIKKHEKTPVQHYLNNVSATPVVSVCVQTYKHERYIRECLDSILVQQTNFDFEVLLGEDESPDKTREICIEYAEKFPDRIRLFLHSRENNVKIAGSATGRFNFMYNCLHAKGKYLAFCEGDDYWKDPLKLQKQYEAMEKNLDSSVCFTAARFHFENDPDKNYSYKPESFEKVRKYSLKDAIYKTGGFMISASIFFRAEYVERMPEWMFTCPVGDMPLSLYLGAKGNYLYLDDETCVYRVMTEGSWSERSNFEIRRQQVKGFLRTLDEFNEYTSFEYDREVKREKQRIRLNDLKAVIRRLILKLF